MITTTTTTTMLLLLMHSLAAMTGDAGDGDGDGGLCTRPSSLILRFLHSRAHDGPVRYASHSRGRYTSRLVCCCCLLLRRVWEIGE